MSELSREHITNLRSDPLIGTFLDEQGRIDPTNRTGYLLKNGKLLDSVARYTLGILAGIKGNLEYYTNGQYEVGDMVFFEEGIENCALYADNGIVKKVITTVSRIREPEQIWIPKKEVYVPNSKDIENVQEILAGYQENMRFVNSVSSIKENGWFSGHYTLKKGNPLFNKEQKIVIPLLEELATQMIQVALVLNGHKMPDNYSSSYLDYDGENHISPISSDQESIEVYLSGYIQSNPEKITKTGKEGFEIIYTVYTQNIAQASGTLVLLK